MHSVVFKNCENSWKNALPLGNGVLGAMAFYKDNTFNLPLNHYEVYYNISENVLPEDILKATPLSKAPGATHQSFYERAERNKPADGEPFFYYRLDKAGARNYDVGFFSGSYPSTGELVFELSDELKDKDSELRLDIEKATVSLNVDGAFKMETLIARSDVVLTEIHGGAGVKAVKIKYLESRDIDYPDVLFKEIDKSTFAYTVKMMLGKEKSFAFAGIIRLKGAEGRLNGSTIEIVRCEKDIAVLTGIFTEWKYKDPLTSGIEIMNSVSAEALKTEHSEYWKSFFDRSGITLPDKFLERVYYINQYALDCSSGKDGIMKHHACGLNGLWDVRHPSLWGSMWYWDVNIQAAFAGVFSSNRLDLGKVFSDGLLTYVGLAEQFAKNVHGLNGAALDYPYTFYFCVWPWCAQYLWAQYEYSQDKEYLKNEAYPLFLKLCRFACELFKYDEERGEYVVYPDISPEQGPLAHNTVITVASVKYMLKFTLEAASILGDENELLEDIRALLKGMPKYPTVTDNYGTRFLDSEDAPANLWIRHPSMLMPIFPTGEIDMDSDEALKQTAMNTVRFLEDNCEIGVFQVSWLAAVSARFGDGQRALRLLYEMGMDHLLRTNGLAAEENERFMNFCLIMRQPLYYPCMMEFTGEMLAAVNEMLMQSNGGVIRLFPAMPNGANEYARAIEKGYGLDEYTARFNEYPAWKDVRFDKLLGRGAFEISSELKDGALIWLKIRSNAGGKLRVTSPYPLSDLGIECKDNIFEADTKLGDVYEFGSPSEKANDSDEEILTHTTYTKRRITIGEDRDTDYIRNLDSFTRDWYLGNIRMENHSVYKFDFGVNVPKDYQKVLFRTGFGAEKMFLHTMAFNRLGATEYTVKKGYGFEGAENISVLDRGLPDELRRDLAEGEKEVQFVIEAPRGQYELFVVSGDENEDSVTLLECDEGRRTGGELIKAGRYQYKLIPLVHENDGLIRLKISTKPGYKWKLNYILVNLYKQM